MVVGKLLAVIRVIALVILLIFAMLLMLIGRLFVNNKKKWNFFCKKSWCRLALKVMGIRVRLNGKIPQQNGYLCISNHTNPIDPFIIMSFIDVRPVGKSEITSYPLIGFGGRQIGMLFVNRNDKSNRLQVKNRIEKALYDGDNILVFPEGTISNERQLKKFKPGSFFAAHSAGAPILPTMISFNEYDRFCWKDKTMLGQLLFQMSYWHSQVTFHIGALKQIHNVDECIGEIREVMKEKLSYKMSLDFYD